MGIKLFGVDSGTNQPATITIPDSPVIALDTIRTSQAGISSDHVEDDKSAELAELLDSKRQVIIDTPIALNQEVFATRDYQRIIGSPTGRLLIGPDMGNSTALRITGNHTQIHGLIMDNPLMIADKTTKTTRQGAIGIQAHNATVRDCMIWRMLHAVYVMSNGEWYGTLIDGNSALECIGAGMGPNDELSNWGEDKGDAFAVWGAGARVVNNYARAMEGQDCRIAFHAEGLPGSHGETDARFMEADFIFANNVAVGSFRRHFVFEDVRRGIMHSNLSAGGATWWPLALVQTKDCQVSNMVLHVTRKAGDLTGKKWNPVPAAICLMNHSDRTTLNDIKAFWSADADAEGIYSQVDNKGGQHIDTRLHGVELYMNPASRRRALNYTGLTAPHFDRVMIRGCAEPFWAFKPKGMAVMRNLDVADFTKPAYVEGGRQGIRVEASMFDNSEVTGGATCAIRTIQTDYVHIRNTVAEGIDHFADIGDASGKFRYLKALSVSGSESVGQPAVVTIDGKSQATTTAAVTLRNNVNIDGEFTPQ